jgi:hypothetical protein
MALPHEPSDARDGGSPWDEERFATVRQLLEDTEPAGAPQDLLERIAAQIPDPAGYRDTGIAVLRDLLKIESRPTRFRRLLRIWEGKVVAAIRDRDLDAVEAWFLVLTDRPDHLSDFAPQAAAAIDALSRPGIIDEFLGWLVEEDAVEAGASLLARWGEPIVRRTIELMTLDEPPFNRRYMVDILAVIGRADSRLLTAYVGDSRWFIVRNLAIALGRTGRLAVVSSLRGLLEHRDARVRVEALRSVAAVDGDRVMPDLAAALEDRDPRVRRAAVTLLRASPNPQVVPMLSTVLRSGKLGQSEAERLVEVLGERRDPAARAVLEEMASKRGFGSARMLRDAARRALRGRAS